MDDMTLEERAAQRAVFTDHLKRVRRRQRWMRFVAVLFALTGMTIASFTLDRWWAVAAGCLVGAGLFTAERVGEDSSYAAVLGDLISDIDRRDR